MPPLHKRSKSHDDKKARSRKSANAAQPRVARDQRLDARLTGAQKDLICRAAELEDESLTTFVVREALKAAKRRILEEEVVKLTEEDKAVLVAALRNPPAPAATLRARFQKYRETFAS